jgi:hypothetical protein
MNRKVLLLNVALLVAVVWLGVRLRANWQESKAKEQETLDRAAQAQTVTAPAPLAGVTPTPAIEYLNVAQQTLFSEDRNSNEIVDVAPPAPPPPPPPPTPPFPTYHGQMSFGEPVIILSTSGVPQKSHRVGDQIGEFKIAGFDRDKLILEWNDKTFEPLLKDLASKEQPKPVVQTQDAPAQQAKAAAVAPVGKGKNDGQYGAQYGNYRECLVDDNSPDGTVKDGYRKAIVGTLMGTSCHWEPIR